MVWDIRPRIPTVKSMSALPMAGFAYAVGAKVQKISTSGPSLTSSPPPEYDTEQTARTESQAGLSQSTQLLSAQDLERALVFEKLKSEARDRSRYIAQGTLMLRSSQETQLTAETTEELQFSKELYLSSLEYLMRGIPSDLTAMEKETLARSLKQVQIRLNLDPGSTIEAETSTARTQQLFVGICRGTAVIIRLSVPRIKRSLETAIELENRYHVLERSTVVLANSLNSVADRATRTTLPMPNVSRLLDLASNLYFGLSLGLQEGYRVLNDEQAF